MLIGVLCLEGGLGTSTHKVQNRSESRKMPATYHTNTHHGGLFVEQLSLQEHGEDLLVVVARVAAHAALLDALQVQVVDQVHLLRAGRRHRQ